MNLVPKTNVWVFKAVQVMRMVNSGSNWTHNANGSCADSPVAPGEKANDLKKESDHLNTATCVGPQPLNVDCRNVRMANAREMLKQEEVDKQTAEFLSRYYGDQIKYFRQMAGVNTAAMKRIKKLKRDWLKFCEKNF